MTEINDITLLEWIMIGIGIVLAIHLFGELVSKKKAFSEHLVLWESFGAGIFVGGFFLEILPNLIECEAAIGQWAFLIFLISTVCVHLIEKELFKHAIRHQALHHPNEPLTDETRESVPLQELAKRPRDRRLIFEAAALVIHGILIGAIMPHLFEKYQLRTFYYLVPFVIHWFTVATCTDHLDYALHSKVEHFVRDISPLVGSIIGFLLIHDTAAYSIYITVLMGFITYIIVRDFLPRSNKGNPLYFIFGVVLIVILFFILGAG